MSLNTSIYIDSDVVLDAKTECLRCILDSAVIEVEVEVDFDYSGGCSGSYESPPESPSADYTNIYVTNISFDADTPLVEENIKVLMTKEQKEAIIYFATLEIENNWGSKYEQEAFDSLPDPDDYDPPDDDYDRY